MSIPGLQERKLRQGRKGCRRSGHDFPVMPAGTQENILRTVTLCGALSFSVLGAILSFDRECWSNSEVHGFLLENLKGREK